MNKKCLIFRNCKRAITLIEVLVASALSSLVIAGAFMLFSQGQSTITRSVWINSVDQSTSIASRRLGELFNRSSYPSTIIDGVIKTAENNSAFFARVVASGTIDIPTSELEILSFPVSTPQTRNSSGTVTWYSINLEPSTTAGYADMNLIERQPIVYDPGPPDYVEDMADGGYLSGNIVRNISLLKDIEEMTVEILPDQNLINIDVVMSYPRNKSFKTKTSLSAFLNVEIYE